MCFSCAKMGDQGKTDVAHNPRWYRAFSRTSFRTVLTVLTDSGHEKGVSIAANPFRIMVDPAEFESATSAFGVGIGTSYSIVIVRCYPGLFTNCAKSLETSKIVKLW